MTFNCITNERSGMGKRWSWMWPTPLPGMCTWYKPALCCARFSQHALVFRKGKFSKRSSVDVMQNLLSCSLNGNSRHLFVGAGWRISAGERIDFSRIIMRWFHLHTKLNESFWEDTFCDNRADSWQLWDTYSWMVFPLHLVAFSPSIWSLVAVCILMLLPELKCYQQHDVEKAGKEVV